MLNHHAPQKAKYARGNQMPFMTKQLSKEIITIFWEMELKKIKFCVSLLRKSNRGYYENVNIKNVIDYKLFRKSVKPLLSDKSHIRDRISSVKSV